MRQLIIALLVFVGLGSASAEDSGWVIEGPDGRRVSFFDIEKDAYSGYAEGGGSFIVREDGVTATAIAFGKNHLSFAVSGFDLSNPEYSMEIVIKMVDDFHKTGDLSIPVRLKDFLVATGAQFVAIAYSLHKDDFVVATIGNDSNMESVTYEASVAAKSRYEKVSGRLDEGRFNKGLVEAFGFETVSSLRFGLVYHFYTAEMHRLLPGPSDHGIRGNFMDSLTHPEQVFLATIARSLEGGE